MVVCAVCESEDFDERDGLLYCQTCMTQSQDYRREEEENEITQCNITSMLVKKKTREKIKKEDQGRPWHSFEGFTIIIREQVKALIKLGASATLMDVVFQLWCNYLSQTGIAFPEDESKMDHFMRDHQRHRERYPGSLQNPEILPVQIRGTHRKRYGLSKAKNEKHMESLNLATTLQEEEFYEGDNPAEQEQEDIIEEEEEEKEEVDPNRLKNMRCQPGWMSMVKTLCFCYIGMLYTDNLVSISDLIRWTGQNKVPYYRATKLIPEDMKFVNAYDSSTFMTTLLKYDMLETETKKLVKYMGLLDVPDVPITAVISKYIVMLDLPGELHGFVANLIQAENLKEERLIKFSDLEAMGYIITTMQLLLGLDDSTERELSSIAVKLNTVFDGRYSMFVWSDWTTHINKKITVGFAESFDDPRNVKDTKTFMENFILFDKDKKKSGSRSRKDKTVRKEMQDALLRPLQKLEKIFQSSSSGQTTNIDMNDDEEYNPALEPTLEDSLVNHFLASEKIQPLQNELQTSNKFRLSSFKYITQPRSFQGSLEKDRLLNLSLQHSSDCDEIDNLSDIDLFESPKKRRKQNLGKRRAKLDAATIQAPCDKEELLQLINQLCSMHECSAVIDDQKQYNDLICQSKSYLWLLRICASLLSCSIERLNFKVMEVQNLLFANCTKGNLNRKKKLISLLKC